MRKPIFKNIAGRIVKIPCEFNSDICQWGGVILMIRAVCI